MVGEPVKGRRAARMGKAVTGLGCAGSPSPPAVPDKRFSGESSDDTPGRISTATDKPAASSRGAAAASRASVAESRDMKRNSAAISPLRVDTAVLPLSSSSSYSPSLPPRNSDPSNHHPIWSTEQSGFAAPSAGVRASLGGAGGLAGAGSMLLAMGPSVGELDWNDPSQFPLIDADDVDSAAVLAASGTTDIVADSSGC